MLGERDHLIRNKAAAPIVAAEKAVAGGLGPGAADPRAGGPARLGLGLYPGFAI